MANGNPYTLHIDSISTDGSNFYAQVSVFDGAHTLPPINVAFTAQTTAAQIQTYFQNVVNNQPALSSSIAALVGTTLIGQ